MSYVIIGIGCLECNVPSELVEVTDSLERVHELRATVATEMDEADWHGQYMKVAFEVEL